MVRYYKKSLGQHFLIDKNIAKKIIKYARISENDIVWEIGPGSGILTEQIIKNCNKLIAFEIDKQWFDFLKEKFTDPKLHLINQDILKVNFTNYAKHEKVKVVANLPYHITSPVIFKLIENRELFSSITIMIQDEVADRIIAKPGCKDYSRLSIKTQFYFEVKKLFTIPPHLFKPKPKVTSAVIQLIPKDEIPKIKNDELLWNIIDYTFQHRRKMLRTSLRTYLDKLDYQILVENSTKSQIDLSRRPEELGIDEFIFLTDIIKLQNI